MADEVKQGLDKISDQLKESNAILGELAGRPVPEPEPPETPAQKKQREKAEEAARNAENTLLKKMGRGITGLFEMGKKTAQVAKLGAKAFLGTLLFGAALIALGKFLQSQYWVKMVEWVKGEGMQLLVNMWENVLKPIGIWLKDSF